MSFIYAAAMFVVFVGTIIACYKFIRTKSDKSRLAVWSGFFILAVMLACDSYFIILSRSGDWTKEEAEIVRYAMADTIRELKTVEGVRNVGCFADEKTGNVVIRIELSEEYLNNKTFIAGLHDDAVKVFYQGILDSSEPDYLTGSTRRAPNVFSKIELLLKIDHDNDRALLRQG